MGGPQDAHQDLLRPVSASSDLWFPHPRSMLPCWGFAGTPGTLFFAGHYVIDSQPIFSTGKALYVPVRMSCVGSMLVLRAYVSAGSNECHLPAAFGLLS